MKEYLPLALMAALVFVIVFAFLMTPTVVNIEYEEEQLCSENQTQSCHIGNCTGISTCVNGRFGPCKLDIICQPRDKVPCIEQGCVQGHKECNSCGTAFGPCIYHDQ